jgi:hypothetical protein
MKTSAAASWSLICAIAGFLIPFRYPGIRNPKSFDIWSAGKDGIEGTADDITNFK